MTTVDRRLVEAGRTLTIADLITLWADHTPAHYPIPLACPGCGHTYSTAAPLCPTAAIVRPLLARRRHETTPDTLLRRLTFNQYRDLVDKHLSTATASLVRLDLSPAPAPTPEPAALFDLTHGGTP